MPSFPTPVEAFLAATADAAVGAFLAAAAAAEAAPVGAAAGAAEAAAAAPVGAAAEAAPAESKYDESAEETRPPIAEIIHAGPGEILRVLHSSRAGKTGAPVWTLDEVDRAALDINPFSRDLPLTLFAPAEWYISPYPCQEAFSAAFTKKFPYIETALGPQLVAAGSSAAWAATCDPSWEPKDVDLFVVNFKPGDNLQEFLDRAVMSLYKAFGELGLGLVFETLSPSIITLNAYNNVADAPCSLAEVQIIFHRPTQTVEELLGGFDLGSCAVAYDGTNTVFSALGAYALVNRVNILDSLLGSSSWEHRILKYFRRGFAIGLPGLAPGLFCPGRTLELSRLKLAADSVYGCFVEGRLSIRTRKLPEPPADDRFYGPGMNGTSLLTSGRFLPKLSKGTVRAIGNNLTQIVSGGKRYTCAICRWPGEPLERRTFEFAKKDVYSSEFCLSLSDVLPRSALAKALVFLAKKVINPIRVVNAKLLRSAFGLSSAEVHKVLASVDIAALANPRTPLSAVKFLEPFAAAVLEKYDAAPKEVAWFPMDGAARDVGSFCPRPESPETWYGPAACQSQHTASDDDVVLAWQGIFQNLRKKDHARFAGCCAICFGPVVSGAPNSITLGCGHTFHWAHVSNHSCDGIMPWFQKQTSCPACRRDFHYIPLSDPGPATRPEVLQIGLP